MNAEPINRPSLRRRVDKRLVAGVVGGIADSLNAPVGVLRVLLALASSFSVWVLVGYAIAALVIPPRGRSRPGWDNLIGLGRIALFFGGSSLLFGSVALNDLFDDSPAIWVPATGLWLTGVAVYLTRNYPRGPSSEEARATVLGALPVIALAVAVAAGVLLAPGVRWERAVPVVVVLAGAVLLAGVVRGNWRFLVGPAVVAAAAGAVLVASETRLQGGVGDRVVVSAGEPPSTERVAVGDLTVNAAEVTPRPGWVTVRASVGVGDLHVVVPRRARLALDLHVGRGTLDTGEYVNGVDLSERDATDARVLPFTPPRPNLNVRVVADVGMGKLAVHRRGSEDF